MFFSPSYLEEANSQEAEFCIKPKLYSWSYIYFNLDIHLVQSQTVLWVKKCCCDTTQLMGSLLACVSTAG